jgi:hypothetical protein
MAGLLGVPVGEIKHGVENLAQFAKTPENTASYLVGSSAADCYIDITYDTCIKEKNDRSWRGLCAKSGYVGVGIAHGTYFPSKHVCKVSRCFFSSFDECYTF